MTKVVSFGEIMLRLSPPGFERFLQSPAFVGTFGGAEASVAVSLAAFGLESWYVTRLPAHEIGEAAIKALRAEGVHTEAIVRGGDRIGVYYVENGASQRAGVVIYDRANSAVSQMEPGDVDWARVLEGAAWFHVTGITPALGARAVACTRAAVRAARAAGARVCLDLNFRSKLWSEAEAQAVMPSFVPDVDLLIGNEEHLKSMLGIQASSMEQACRDVGVPMVALTHRESVSASDNGWSASLWDKASQTLVHSQRYDVRLVDRLGGGDAFAAGLIFGLVSGRSPEAALRFAVAAGALNQTIPGDFNRVSVAEVDRLADGDGSGRVRR